MQDSMAHPRGGLVPLGIAGWKTAAGWAAAVVIGILFLTSGVWKISDVQGWAARLTQALVPEQLSLAGALFFGIAETVAGVFLLVPRFRRWGAILASLLLAVFLVYFAIHFDTLRGQDCSCFPWLKRVVGPGFFLSDGIMLALAVCAGFWSRRPQSVRTALVILGSVTVFALVSYGAVAVRQTGARAPETIQVNGRPYSLEQGRFFAYFINPQCMHCLDAAKRMAKLQWGDTKVVVVPVGFPEFAGQFLEQTGLQAVIASDFEKLKTAAGYTAYPFGVAIENGRIKAQITNFDKGEPAATLRQLGLAF